MIDFFPSNRALLLSIFSPFKADDNSVFGKLWYFFPLKTGNDVGRGGGRGGPENDVGGPENDVGGGCFGVKGGM